MTPVAITAGLAGGLAAGVADLVAALVGPAPPDAAQVPELALSTLSLLTSAGFLVGWAARGAGLALGRARAEAIVRSIAGEPRGALCATFLAAAVALGGTLAVGWPLARVAFDRGSGGAAAVAAAVGLGAGALLFRRTRRLALRFTLPAPVPTLLAATAAASGVLAFLLREGGPLEALDGRPLWVALAGAISAFFAAAWLARRRDPRRRPLLVAAAAGAALAGSGASVFVVAGEPEARGVMEGAPVTGLLLEGVRRSVSLDVGRPSALELLAKVAPAGPPPGRALAGSAPPAATSTSAPARPPHLVLLTVDALRADRVGAYGCARPLTPALDALAARAVVFERAYSQESKTKGSIPSLLTSRYPSDIQWGGQRYVPLGDAEITIAEILLKAGYHTAAFVTHSYFLPKGRLDRGFAHYDTELVSTDPEIAFGRPSSAALADRVIEYLGRIPRGRPFFLWAHFFDPHHRYLRHPGFSRFGERASDRYDGEIAHTDHHLGRVLRALEAHPEAARIAVIVTADHGEAFGEHGRFFHGTTLYDEEIRVPFLLSVPGLAPRRETTPVGVIDVAPTLVDLAGFPPAPQHRGRSLLAAARGQPLDPRPVFAEILPEDRIGARSAVVHRSWKLVYDERRNALQLFNLREDPGERANRLRKDPLVASELAAILFQWRAREVPPGLSPLAREHGGLPGRAMR
jgi:arylsulfatase A-like enzyme